MYAVAALPEIHVCILLRVPEELARYEAAFADPVYDAELIIAEPMVIALVLMVTLVLPPSRTLKRPELIALPTHRAVVLTEKKLSILNEEALTVFDTYKLLVM